MKLTFEQCQVLKFRAGKKKLAANTYLFADEKNKLFYVMYYNTCIITIKENYFILNIDSYQTRTTKDRLNEFLSIGHIYQEKNVWYYSNGTTYNESNQFFNYIQIDYTGRILNPLSNKEIEKKAKKELQYKKLVSSYIDKFCKTMIKKPFYPSGGDCWLCMFDEPEKDVQHILRHLKEKYIFGTLLFNAIKYRKYGNYEFIYSLCTKDSKFIKQELKYYFKSLRTKIIELL